MFTSVVPLHLLDFCSVTRIGAVTLLLCHAAKRKAGVSSKYWGTCAVENTIVPEGTSNPISWQMEGSGLNAADVLGE